MNGLNHITEFISIEDDHPYYQIKIKNTDNQNLKISTHGENDKKIEANYYITNNQNESTVVLKASHTRFK